MTVGEFADMVERMREAQKAYDNKPGRSRLYEKDEMEARVDKILTERRERMVQEARQGSLFDIESTKGE